MQKTVLYIPDRHIIYPSRRVSIPLASSLASAIAPLSEGEENLLDTPFENWPIRKSLTDATCDCCGHIECVND